MWKIWGGDTKPQETINNRINKSVATPKEIFNKATQLELYTAQKTSELPIEVVAITYTITNEIKNITSIMSYLPTPTLHNLHNTVNEYLPELYKKYLLSQINPNDHTNEANISLTNNVITIMRVIKEIKNAIINDNKKQLEIETKFLTNKFEGSHLEDAN